jgi:hypothetical protein
MYNYKQINLNKEDVKKDLEKAIKETEGDLNGTFADVEPMYYVNDIPVINSSAITEEFDTQFASLISFADGTSIIITDILFNKYLSEDEQNVILAHEIGHFEYRNKGIDKKSMSKLEWEILADMYAVNMYGHEKVLDTLFKTAKIAQLIYDDIDTDEIKYRMVEIQMNQLKNR